MMAQQQQQQQPPKGSTRRASVGDCYHFQYDDSAKNNDDSHDEKLIHLAKIRDILNAPAPPKPAKSMQRRFLRSHSTEEPPLQQKQRQQCFPYPHFLLKLDEKSKETSPLTIKFSEMNHDMNQEVIQTNCRTSGQDRGNNESVYVKKDANEGGKAIMEKYFNSDEFFEHPSFCSEKMKGFQSSSSTGIKEDYEDGGATASTAACTTIETTATGTGKTAATAAHAPFPASSRTIGSRNWKKRGDAKEETILVSRLEESMSSLDNSSHSFIMACGTVASSKSGSNGTSHTSTRSRINKNNGTNLLIHKEEHPSTASDSSSPGMIASAIASGSDTDDIHRTNNSNSVADSAATETASPPVKSDNDDAVCISCSSTSSCNGNDRDSSSKKIMLPRPKFKPSSIHWENDNEDDEKSHHLSSDNYYSKSRKVDDIMDAFLLGREMDDDNDIGDDQGFDRHCGKVDIFAEELGLKSNDAERKGAKKSEAFASKERQRQQNRREEPTPVPRTSTPLGENQGASPNLAHSRRNNSERRRASDCGPPISSIIIIRNSGNAKNRRSSSNNEYTARMTTRATINNGDNCDRQCPNQEDCDQKNISKVNHLIDEYQKFLDDDKRLCSASIVVDGSNSKAKMDIPPSSGRRRRASADTLSCSNPNRARGQNRGPRDKKYNIIDAACSIHIKNGDREKKSNGNATANRPPTRSNVKPTLCNKDKLSNNHAARAAHHIDDSFIPNVNSSNTDRLSLRRAAIRSRVR
ncbi:hypothetical protein ACHAXS_001479 [Conticribra weissflogii]